MTIEEATYWKNYIEGVIISRLAALTNIEVSAANIRTFAERHMQLVTGQQMLPQQIFRMFCEEFAPILKWQTELSELVERAEAAIAGGGGSGSGGGAITEINYSAIDTTETPGIYDVKYTSGATIVKHYLLFVSKSIHAISGRPSVTTITQIMYDNSGTYNNGYKYRSFTTGSGSGTAWTEQTLATQADLDAKYEELYDMVGVAMVL